MTGFERVNCCTMDLETGGENTELRDYQNELLSGIHESWRRGHRSPCMVLPCGGGKSCITAEMARRTTAKGRRVLFLVHRRELCEQIEATFSTWGVDMSLCTVGMVQTVTRRLDGMEPPALIITDENHHCLAASYKRIYEAFPEAYKVGVTATPIRLNGDGLGDVNDDLVIGVDAKWLIEHAHLAPYDYYAPTLIDMTGVHIRQGEYKAAEVEAKMLVKALYGDMIRHYRELADGRQAICYCATLKHSRAVAEAFCAAGIPAAHIDGETPAGERADIVQGFRDGDIRVLCNVDLISEGFDVPDCSCAILARPTKSLTLFIQQAMRCMRYQPGKRAVIIDHVGNYARHGLPDMARTWTLAKRSRERAPNEVKVMQCPDCMAVFEGDECPYCGWHRPAEAQPRKLLDEVDVTLQKIEGVTLDFRTPEDCKTFAELRAYGKAHGYKPGWAWYQAKMRGYIRERA